MPVQAPYDYIRDYYRRSHEKNLRFPEITAFWQSALRGVRGESVLNVGCGPQLYDYLPYFAEMPGEYLGLDINRQTFTFLESADEARLLEAKARAAKAGTRVELLCGDVLDSGPELESRFDCVLGVGVIATFAGARFEQLMAKLRGALKDQGRLVKVTWHGPLRSAEETEKKLKYGFDNVEEPSPEALAARIERAGFEVQDNSVLKVVPRDYGWNAIQICTFRKLRTAVPQTHKEVQHA